MEAEELLAGIQSGRFVSVGILGRGRVCRLLFVVAPALLFSQSMCVSVDEPLYDDCSAFIHIFKTKDLHVGE